MSFARTSADADAHRLRAIGHLYEAEDESQEFPDLHAAIREGLGAWVKVRIGVWKRGRNR
jgi:hypothetical protein